MTSRLWYRAELRGDLVSAHHVSIIREQFTEALEAAGWPDGACLFLITGNPRRRRMRNSARYHRREIIQPHAADDRLTTTPSMTSSSFEGRAGLVPTSPNVRSNLVPNHTTPTMVSMVTAMPPTMTIAPAAARAGSTGILPTRW